MDTATTTDTYTFGQMCREVPGLRDLEAQAAGFRKNKPRDKDRVYVTLKGRLEGLLCANGVHLTVSEYAAWDVAIRGLCDALDY